MKIRTAKISDFFYREKSYTSWFWIITGIVFFIDVFWFHPSTRHLAPVQIVELIFLQHPFSPLELIQQIVIIAMIGYVWNAKDQGSFRGYELFRKLFLSLLVLVFLEEVSWGQIIHAYPWPEAILPFMGNHDDVHNVMIGRADIADLMEAMAAVFTCLLVARPRNSSVPLIPSLPLTRSSFHMLAFSFLTSPLSMIREVNEQDIIFETAIFAALTMGILAGTGQLVTLNDDWEDRSAGHRWVLWLLLPLPWIKFFFLVIAGHYPVFPVWP